MIELAIYILIIVVIQDIGRVVDRLDRILDLLKKPHADPTTDSPDA